MIKIPVARWPWSTKDFSTRRRLTCPSSEVAKGSELDRTHIIEGLWKSKEIHINDALITVDMVMERINDFCLVEKNAFTAFAWGPDAPDREVSALAYGCTEFTVPETWIRSIR